MLLPRGTCVGICVRPAGCVRVETEGGICRMIITSFIRCCGSVHNCMSVRFSLSVSRFSCSVATFGSSCVYTHLSSIWMLHNFGLRLGEGPGLYNIAAMPFLCVAVVLQRIV